MDAVFRFQINGEWWETTHQTHTAADLLAVTEQRPGWALAPLSPPDGDVLRGDDPVDLSVCDRFVTVPDTSTLVN